MKQKKNMAARNEKGVHYIVDAFGCKANLDSVETVHGMLVKLIKMVGMKRLSDPYVVDYKGENKLNNGVTGIILLSESHVSIHTYSNTGEFYFDLFSCRPFDVKVVRDFIKKTFQISDMNETVIRRGLIR